jgi:glutathionylspermidine synthase
VRRERIPVRPGWQQRLEEAGCYFHTIDGKPYWRDDAAYVLSSADVDRIEDAANELHNMCLELAADVVRRGDYQGYGFPDEVRQLVETSWSMREPGLYGRFDLGLGADGALKLWEYNADTPTALPEAAVWQWHALQDRGWPEQFNSIHEALLVRWPTVVTHKVDDVPKRLHFAAMQNGQHEDWGNVHYLLETAAEAGFDVSSINIEEIGWNGQTFTDIHERPIELLFKLYPWEWMMADEFGWNVHQAKALIIEPAWKMLWSTKALLPLLWQRHPNHPLLLEAYTEQEFGALYHGRGDWVRKPLLGREGANVSRVRADGKAYVASDVIPQYDNHGYVLQRWHEPQAFDGNVPVLGAWVIGDRACGLGIREDTSAITTNASCFVPHYFTEGA